VSLVACFVHDLTLGKDKFFVKSLKSIFLDYSHLQKGYRCFSPKLQRYIVSVDDTFFKTTPFYTSTILDVNLTVESLEVSPDPTQVIASQHPEVLPVSTQVIAPPQRLLLQQVQTSIVTHSTNPQASSPAPIAHASYT